MTEDKNHFTDLALKHINRSASLEEEEELLGLLDNESTNKVEFHNLAKVRALGFVSSIEKNKQANYNKLTQHLNKDLFTHKYRKLITTILRATAVIIIAVGIGITASVITTKEQDKGLTETIIPFGSQCKVVLPDGTVVWLNSGSKLKYEQDFGQKTRDVYLSGEGYFEVAKNTVIPFLVHTKHIELKVIGTTFNIRSYLEDPTTEVNLIEGKVDIRSVENNKRSILKPNESMVYTNMSGTMRVQKSDASKAALWTTGKLAFVDETIQDITNKLERKFDVQIILNSEYLKKEVFSGTLDMNKSINEILDYLDVDKKYKKQYNGNRITISN